MLGTPNYMAPEQFRGERTDPRSDIYGVGAVLYHMLTGIPPYGREVLRFLIGDEKITLDTSAFESSPLLEIVTKSLAHKPETRYSCAKGMWEEVDRVKQLLKA